MLCLPVFTVWDKIINKKLFSVVEVPAKAGSRVHAQRGVFTFLRSNEHTDIESYLQAIGQENALDCFVFKSENAAHFLSHLKLMGINYLSLFPDEYGAAIEAGIYSNMIPHAARMNWNK